MTSLQYINKTFDWLAAILRVGSGQWQLSKNDNNQIKRDQTIKLSNQSAPMSTFFITPHLSIAVRRQSERLNFTVYTKGIRVIVKQVITLNDTLSILMYTTTLST